MERSIAWYSVRYVAACEWALSFFFALYAVIVPIAAFFFSRYPDKLLSRSFAIAAAVVLGGLAATCFCSGIALIRRARWAWFCSLAIGIGFTILGLAAVSFVFQVHEKPTEDAGFRLAFGGFLLLLSVTGLILLSLSQTRKYILASHATGSDLA
jgi:MFS family permease